MNSYEKIGWLDHVEDVATGEVIQEGTPVSQTNMNHMDEGIYGHNGAQTERSLNPWTPRQGGAARHP